ncbi:hypothetical protein Ancab_039918 [Ancistrocladus abbreviatus]
MLAEFSHYKIPKGLSGKALSTGVVAILLNLKALGLYIQCHCYYAHNWYSKPTGCSWFLHKLYEDGSFRCNCMTNLIPRSFIMLDRILVPHQRTTYHHTVCSTYYYSQLHAFYVYVSRHYILYFLLVWYIKLLVISFRSVHSQSTEQVAVQQLTPLSVSGFQCAT